MKEIRTSVDIEAPPSAVWKVLVDFPRYPEWNPFITRIHGEAQLGARLEIRIEPAGGKAMQFKPTVTRVSMEREFRWVGRLLMPGLFDGEHIFDIEASALGSRVVHREEFKGILVPLFWNSMSPLTRQGFEHMNIALKARAESLTSEGLS